MYLSNTESFDLWSVARRQRRVLLALMLRNMRTRFFGNGLGYLVAIGWPFSHILILVTVWTFMGRAAPYGDSPALFLATGVVPFMVFSYLARMTMLSIMRCRPLLAFPEVKVLDVILASTLLEVIAVSCATIAILAIGWFVGIDVMPRDPVQVASAFGATVLLGFGFGVFNGTIALAFPAWFTGYSLITVLLWLSAGVLFVPDALPGVFREAAAYQPVLQVVEWTRSGYYEGYGDLVLNRPYTLEFGVTAVFFGLLLERAMRGKILGG
jgi:capsular polysaccharide transport system permease protein